MSYESWRITFQSSEQAAQSAYAKVEELAARLAELEGQEPEPVFWYRPCCDGEMYEGPIHNAQIERVRRLSGAWVPLYARLAPAAPVNARLLEAMKNLDANPEITSAWISARAAIAAAEAQQAGPVRLTEAEIGRIDRQSREGIKSLMSTWPVPLARAIEDAVLERNGIKPIPTAVTIAPRGYSWHGDRLQKDELGTLTCEPQAKGD